MSAFWIDRSEVTVQICKKCVEAGGCKPPKAGRWCNYSKESRDDHLVNCVAWHQAAAYCKWAGAT